MTTAAAASRSSATLSLCCGGGGRAVSSLQTHSASASASGGNTLPLLRRISMFLHRLQRRHPQRHADAEVRPWHFTIDDFHGAVVHMDELVHHRKADTGSAHMAAGGAAGIEGIEDAGSILMGNSGATVSHLQRQLLAAAARTQMDHAAT